MSCSVELHNEQSLYQKAHLLCHTIIVKNDHVVFIFCPILIIFSFSKIGLNLNNFSASSLMGGTGI